MDWTGLLCRDRLNAPTVPELAGQPTVFQDDAERIIYTSSFRRLQGKTQVYPFPSFDYLRTRLTHTIEVANAGRVIATTAANQLSGVRPAGINAQDCGDIVYAACLAHDLGNPPFGHIGEYAIQTWFADKKTVPEFAGVLSHPDTMNDFLCFDGNAQGFRILTKLASWRNDGGMQVTYAVLGAFSKYPHPSSAIPPGGKKKFRFMHAERDIATKVYTQLGLRNPRGGYLRHPLAYIVEAADDICYLTADVDDAHRMERLSTSAAEALLEPIGRLGGTIGRYSSIPVVEERDRISYLRSGAAAALIKEAIKQFYDREDSLLRGNVIESLLNVSVNYSRHIREITDKCRQLVYTERSKLQIEAAGYNVIKGLLDYFGGMVQQLIKQGSVNDLNPKDKGLYDLLPKEFRDRLLPGDPYECLLVLVDYVSGMTDRFALDLYQRLTGTSVVLGRMA